MNEKLLKKIAAMDNCFSGGHGLCAGCPIPVIIRIVCAASKKPLVVVNASGCLQCAGSRFPESSWKTSWINGHSVHAAAMVSGIEKIYSIKKMQGNSLSDTDVNFIVVAGDGATFDTGLNSLVNAFSRSHNFTYLCLDNQTHACSGGYSSATTPIGAATKTAPAGKILPGKTQFSRDVFRFIRSLAIPYAAQADISFWDDLYGKAEKCFATEGPAFLNVLTPCPTHWGFDRSETVHVSRMAVESCAWPLFEIISGKDTRLNYIPEKKVSLSEWLVLQGRYSHLQREENNWVTEEYQSSVNKMWELLTSIHEEVHNN